MREIKFRQRVNGRFHYWGFMDGGFIGPINPFDPSQQFTGLLDRNRKEVWEGNILRGKDDRRALIIWDTGSFRMAEGPDVWEVNGHIQYWEVIGNIYEHPELLEPAK